MSRRKDSKEAIPLYPGITLRGGEVIMWEPESWKKLSKKGKKRGRFTAAVENPVDRWIEFSRNYQKGDF